MKHEQAREVKDKNTGKLVPIYDAAAFAAMRNAGRLAAMVLDHITRYIQIGSSTEEIDDEIDKYVQAHDAISATLNYRGYPKSSCISLNDVVNHGIPDRTTKIKEGDILNIDVTVILDGWYGDTSRMFIVDGGMRMVGRKPVTKKQRELFIDVTYDALWAGINAVRPGATLGDVGFAIQSVAKAKKYSIVRDFVGHGIGRVFHDAPEVRHYGKRGDGLVLQPGMIFTIEPMVNMGAHHVKILEDGWTTITCDGSLSAQFEHTVGVTEDGYEVFTRSPKGYEKPPYSIVAD